MSEYKLIVEDFGTFKANAGEKLVNALERNGIDVSHRCGGKARCTTCKVVFSSVEPPMGESERACLVEDGVLGEFRLSCQILVEQDMDLAVLMQAKQQGWDPGPTVEP